MKPNAELRALGFHSCRSMSRMSLYNGANNPLVEGVEGGSVVG